MRSYFVSFFTDQQFLLVVLCSQSILHSHHFCLTRYAQASFDFSVQAVVLNSVQNCRERDSTFLTLFEIRPKFLNCWPIFFESVQIDGYFLVPVAQKSKEPWRTSKGWFCTFPNATYGQKDCKFVGRFVFCKLWLERFWLEMKFTIWSKLEIQNRWK